MNDDFFDGALGYIKSTYCSFLANSDVNVKTKPFCLKDFMQESSIFENDDGIIISNVNEQDLPKFKKIILLEFEQFYSKAFVQYIDFLNQKASSKTWNIVTYYYFLFFLITALSRLFVKGCVYLNKQEAQSLNQNFINDCESKFTAGNFVYSLSVKDSTYKLIFEKKTTSVHEESWIIFCDYLKLLEQKSFSKTPEKMLLSSLKKCFDKYDATFPSKIRNDVNYKGICAIQELDNCVPAIQRKELKNILHMNPKKNDDISDKTQTFFYLGIYLYNLTNLIYKDISSRQEKDSNIFSKKRLEYAEKNSDIDLEFLCNLCS